METLQITTDEFVEVRGPINASTGAAIVAGATITGAILEPRSEVALAVSTQSPANELPVDRVDGWAVGDIAWVEFDDGTRAATSITGIDVATKTFTVNPTSEDLVAGARIRRLVGTITGFAAYGTPPTTPVPNDPDPGWGFRATVPDSLSGSVVGRQLEIEIDFSAGAGLRRVFSYRALVVK